MDLNVRQILEEERRNTTFVNRPKIKTFLFRLIHRRKTWKK